MTSGDLGWPAAGQLVAHLLDHEAAAAGPGRPPPGEAGCGHALVAVAEEVQPRPRLHPHQPRPLHHLAAADGEAGLGAGRQLEADEVLVCAEGFIVIHQTHPAAPVPAARLPLDDCLIRWNVVFISPSDNRNTFPFLSSRPRFILLCIVY